ncbi:hypothetical protein ACFLYQ_05210 [Chloroflexota bacterium]
MPESGKEAISDFDKKLLIFEKILGQVNLRKQKDKAFVIGITGIDCSGKSTFSESLQSFFISRGFNTQSLHLDDFHNPSSYRYSGENQAENYFNKSFDIDTIINETLIPVHQNKSFSTILTLLNLMTDKYEIRKEYSINQNTIVIFEGVFLFREDLAPYIDYKVFVEIPFEESKRRALIRDNKASLKKYDEKYLPAQIRYLEEFPPSKTADIVIDNSNWEYPEIIRVL